MDVVLLAGGKCDAELSDRTGCVLRAELPFSGEPMARRVSGVLRAALGQDLRLISVGMPAEGAIFVPAGNSFVDSLRNGLEAVTSDSFLLCAADLPFLTSAAVRAFLARCDPSAAVNYPIVPVALCEERFPGMRRTSLRLREGRFTGGNLALANSRLMRKVFPTLERAYENRKRPLRLAFQARAGLRVLLGQLMPWTLSIATLERSVGKMLGAAVKAIPLEFPEVGADIDDLAQYEQAVQLLENAARG